MTFRPTPDVAELIEKEQAKRPGVALSFLINEALRHSLQVPAAQRRLRPGQKATKL